MGSSRSWMGSPWIGEWVMDGVRTCSCLSVSYTKWSKETPSHSLTSRLCVVRSHETIYPPIYLGIYPWGLIKVMSTLPYLAWSYLTLSCPNLSCLVLPYLTFPYLRQVSQAFLSTSLFTHINTVTLSYPLTVVRQTTSG